MAAFTFKLRDVSVTLLLMTLALFAPSNAIYLPNVYGSSMVFQHSQPVALWGMVTPNDQVKVTLGNVSQSATATATGRFDITLPAQPVSTTGVNIVITSNSNGTITLEDVLFGNVYVCSGQSNMELSVIASINATDYIAAAGQLPTLRIMQVVESLDYYNVTTPQDDLNTTIAWAKPSPTNVAGFSAMCYYYGIEQVTRHPDTPVGMIASSWGGTDAQVWMSPTALAHCGAATTDTKSQQQQQQQQQNQQQHQQQQRRNPDPGLGYLNLAQTTTASSDRVGVVSACPQIPSTLWNSMINPLTVLKVTGFLWYQGESNAGDPVGYECLFPSLIQQWRSSWGAAAATPTSSSSSSSSPSSSSSSSSSSKPLSTDFPFIFVQIAPWPDHDVGAITGIRYSQLAALKLTNVGMVVAADIGDPAGTFHPIHPPWKQEVARRAAVIAENLVHGNTTVLLQGPKPVKVLWSEWDASWGNYHHGIQQGVCASGGGFGWKCGGVQITFDQPITLNHLDSSSLNYGMGGGGGFELWNNITVTECDTPGKPPCSAKGPTGETLTTSTCTDCSVCPCMQPLEVAGVLADGFTIQLNTTFVNGEPMFVRYGWHDYPTMIVYGENDRPAPPFNASFAAAASK